MKKNFKTVRITAALLALLLLSSLFVACAETDGGETTTEGGAASTTLAPDVSTVPETTRDTLPELDYGAEDVHILYWENANNNEFYVEQTDGTEINDVLFRRNENVTQRLNINIVWNAQKGAAGNADSLSKYVRTGIEAGDSLELIAVHSMVMGSLAVQGYLQNLNDVEYINLNAPWWPADLVENSTIHGNIFFVSGDISLNTILGMEGIFFNKDMTETNYYSLVHNKEWTLARMFEETQAAYKDTTGDGKTKDDTFGLSTFSTMMNAIHIGAGIRITDKDEEGQIIFSDSFVSEKTQGILDLVIEQIYNNSACYYDKDWSPVAVIFREERSLFAMASVRYTVNELIGSDVTYGILPMPLYDSDQESYHTLMANTYTMYGIAEGAKDTSKLGAVIEAMASEGYHTVTPVVFEVALKARYSDESSDAMMFDILRETVVMEIGLVFSNNLGNFPSSALINMVNSKSSNWISYMKTYERKINNYLKELNESFES